ncbi:hypothetical protein BpHYR1_008270 [Brachionus plicatilis]|uniref:Uncharacterized protein n=1 Tax=Brachionus plicatilis TaxID=10195 RepID=A0A3M7STJ3_BRAPC|nr:hypothetical protein BpHYR1_008270 [Brachionus plicatilis]
MSDFDFSKTLHLQNPIVYPRPAKQHNRRLSHESNDWSNEEISRKIDKKLWRVIQLMLRGEHLLLINQPRILTSLPKHIFFYHFSFSIFLFSA